MQSAQQVVKLTLFICCICELQCTLLSTAHLCLTTALIEKQNKDLHTISTHSLAYKPVTEEWFSVTHGGSAEDKLYL